MGAFEQAAEARMAAAKIAAEKVKANKIAAEKAAEQAAADLVWSTKKVGNTGKTQAQLDAAVNAASVAASTGGTVDSTTG